MIDLSKYTVLVVDDAPTNIDIIVDALEDSYEVCVAMDGRNALNVVESDPPDLILLDIMMPGMDGYEVCQKLKSNEASKEIPIIFITAKSEAIDETKGFELGAVDYITKPFNVEIVKARVKTHLELKHSRDLIEEYNEKLESMLHQRTKELVKSERQAAFGQLVQGIVHNMRNPLNVISMSFELLETKTKGIRKLAEGFADDTKKELNDAILTILDLCGAGIKSTQRLENMLKSMMLRGRRDKSSAIENVDLNDMIRQELDFMAADNEFKNNTKKTIKLMDKKICIEVVPAEIAQVIQNLLRNAMDAMYNKSEKKLEIVSADENDFAVFRLIDNGAGIPNEGQSKIFDPFFTTKPKADDKERGDEPPGTGLGLWMCKETIESYGGSIDVKSKLGEGTEFNLRLPLKQ